MAATGGGTYFLFTNQTTDANSTPAAVNYPNKIATIKVWGTFDGASVKFQTLAPQSSPNVWIDIPNVDGSTLAFSENKQSTLLYLVQNEQIRAVLSGAGASTTINASLEIY
jgi:hypothetical protein